jgi:DNA mismatch endonuclease (patch repair protein)
MDRVTSGVRSRIMARVKSRNTTPELVVRKALHSAGVRYRLHVGELPGKPDLVLRSRGIAIFVHGCFWHGCPRCSRRIAAKSNLAYWKPKIARNRQRDRRQQAELRRRKWKVRIIWECDTRNPRKLSAFVARIEKSVRR